MINIIHIKHCKLLLCCKNQKHHDVSDNGIRCPSGTAITRLKNQGDADTGARYPQFNLNDDISGLTGIPSISSALSVYRQFKSSAPRGAQIFKLVNTIIVNTFQSTCPARGTASCSARSASSMAERSSWRACILSSSSAVSILAFAAFSERVASTRSRNVVA